MLQKKLSWVVILLLGLTSAAIFAGTIQGTITADGGVAVEGALVHIENSKGAHFTAWSDQKGFYRVVNLAPETYTVWLEKIDFYEVDTPSCGFYNEYLEGTDTFDFNLRATGVMIDFGDPPGPGGKTSLTTTLTSNQIAFSIFMFNLESVNADTIDVMGYWYIPGQGKLEANVASGWAAGPYMGSTMLVTYENLASYLTHYTLRNHGPINIDGELATFTLNLSTSAVSKLNQVQGKLAFCGVSIRMYRRGVLVYSDAPHWVGHRSDLSSNTALPQRR